MKLKQLIKAYFPLNGTQTQFNVVSTDDLHKATLDDFIRRMEQSL